MPINPNEDTEFNDALRKHGILPPRPKTPSSPSPPPSPSLEDRLDDLDDAELLELEEEAKNDETERCIREYYEQRLKEQKRQASRARFGRVYPIGRDDYTREVTDASELGDEEKRGTGVVCFLYKDGIPRSDRAFHQVNMLAHKHPCTKFVSIVGDKCIENLPDVRLPMFIIYRQGEIKNQIISWGADRERSLEELEAMLMMSSAIDHPDKMPSSSHRQGEEGSEDDHDDVPSRLRPRVISTNAYTQKNIRSSGDDSGSEFEFDI